ncbi:ADP-ribose pyrophosphatase YjhB, NUDIX family [Paenibacillus catalpae]|uniref:ADP-ribose pyrophosphatase YjhB, NUDIX family n=1 Tax=Paenibacillus catalpae TaxID=1045775 RepID=A0A1I2AYI1_9BACL|nr:NUDIX hydrolase [Paenibacillus catalpae]SFE48807.1 ADP-ribose pyrophosphatase YjhB, NUDIX family [Paenibacillus catalpae]
MSDKLMGAAAIITNAEGKILLVKHSYGKNNWDLPGGKSEINESVQQTAAREVLEETGLQVEIGTLTGIYYDPAYDMHHFVFIAACDGDQQPIPNSPEILECRYCTPDDLPRPISDFTYNRILDALNTDRRPPFHTIGPRQWI